MKISELKDFAGKVVVLQMADGEVVKVRVCFADQEYGDIIVDVLESTRYQPYDSANAYSIAASEIVSVDVSP